ncbi:carbonic anhydrase [Maricaulis sp.]|uniref:carbonic anhydrase n=1 Tax=Maricaulis sp. TaxID=1486257 RepID=UPI003A8F923C
MTQGPPEQLAAGYRRFRATSYKAQSSLYQELSQGQKPHTLVIACSDSRVDPVHIFGARPGDLFVVRNVANLVPQIDLDGGRHGVSAALEFAVEQLAVKHVVVMGHGQCGGIEACAVGLDKLESTFLGPWLEPLEPTREEVLAKVGEASLATVCDQMELLAVQQSVGRLHQFPFVTAAVKSRGMQLHGARFSIATGILEWMRSDGVFEPVEP